MGQDIHGGIEVRFPGIEAWHSVISLVPLADRNRRLWEWLFQKWGPYPPVFPDRGIPEDVSYELGKEIDALGSMIGSVEAHSFTWLTWQEIEAIDLDEGPRLHKPDSAKTRSQRDTLVRDPTWILIFDLMRRLADDYGGERVRIVVWFDG